MNQPTREEFEQLKEHVKRIEQQTEPINVRIERGLPIPEATLLQTIMDMVGRQGPDIGQLKVHMEGVKADIKSIRASQSDFKERLEEHGKRLAATATKDDLTAMQGQIKQDIGTLETRLDRMESTQEQILKLLQQKSGE